MMCVLQTHLYEDRVMKIGRIDIGKGVTVGARVRLSFTTRIATITPQHWTADPGHEGPRRRSGRGIRGSAEALPAQGVDHSPENQAAHLMSETAETSSVPAAAEDQRLPGGREPLRAAHGRKKKDKGSGRRRPQARSPGGPRGTPAHRRDAARSDPDPQAVRNRRIPSRTADAVGLREHMVALQQELPC